MLSKQDVFTLIDTMPDGALAHGFGDDDLEHKAASAKREQYKTLFDDPRFADVDEATVARVIAFEVIDLELNYAMRDEERFGFLSRDSVLDIYSAASEGQFEPFDDFCRQILGRAHEGILYRQRDGSDFALQLIDIDGTGRLADNFGLSAATISGFEDTQGLAIAALPVIETLGKELNMLEPEETLEIDVFDFSNPLGLTEEEFARFLEGYDSFTQGIFSDFVTEYDFHLYDGEDQERVMDRGRLAVAIHIIAEGLMELDEDLYPEVAGGCHNHAQALARATSGRYQGADRGASFRSRARILVEKMEVSFARLAENHKAALAEFAERSGWGSGVGSGQSVEGIPAEQQEHFDIYMTCNAYMQELSLLRKAAGLPLQTRSVAELPTSITSRIRTVDATGEELRQAGVVAPPFGQEL